MDNADACTLFPVMSTGFQQIEGEKYKSIQGLLNLHSLYTFS